MRLGGSQPYTNRVNARLPPCARSQAMPPERLEHYTGMSRVQAAKAPVAEYCAAYLAYIMSMGAEALEQSKVRCRANAMCWRVTMCPDVDVTASLAVVGLWARCRA